MLQATTVTDVFALYLLKKASLYRKKKYQQVETSGGINNGSGHIYDSEYVILTINVSIDSSIYPSIIYPSIHYLSIHPFEFYILF